MSPSHRISIGFDVTRPHGYGANSLTISRCSMPKQTSYPFEASLARLETLVDQMETGDLSLEDSLKTFEEGIKLTRECQQALKAAEQKVKVLIERNGTVEEQAFQGQDD